MYTIPFTFHADRKVQYGVSIDICHPQYDDYVGQSLMLVFGALGQNGLRSMPSIELDCTEIPSVVAAFRKAADQLEAQYAAARRKPAPPATSPKP